MGSEMSIRDSISPTQHGRPSEGYVVPSVDMSPIASPQYKMGPPGDEAQALTRKLQTFLDSSNVVPRTALEIAHDAAVWCLYVDIVVLSADGGLLDAAALAAVAALKDTTLPKAVYDVDTRKCVCEDTYKPLELACQPTLVTFVIYDSYVNANRTYLLADPNAFEESLISAKIEIGIGSDDPTYLLQTGNCTALDLDSQERISNAQLIEKCVTLARSRAAALRRLL